MQRTTFARQAANLWAAKRALWEHLLHLVEHAPRARRAGQRARAGLSFRGATFCRGLREISAYGHDPVARQTFYGVRADLGISWPGVTRAFDLAPANVSDPAMAPEILD